MDRPRDCPLWGVRPWTCAGLTGKQVQRLGEKRAPGGLTARPRTDWEAGCKEVRHGPGAVQTLPLPSLKGAE